MVIKCKLFAASIIISSIFLCSCATYRYIYTASSPNNPYFVKKGESKLSASYSASSNGQADEAYAGGINLQGAYSMSDHWAIAGTYFNSREKDVYGSGSEPFDSSTVKYKRNLFELSAGYFTFLDKHKNITFNLYGGMGYGKFSIDDNGEISTGVDYGRFHKTNITKWFLQPAFNFRPLKNFRLALILKTSLVHFGDIKTSYTAYELNYFKLDRFTNKTIFFFEPAWNFQFGLQKYPWVKLDGTFSGVSDNAYTESNVRQSNFSIGLNFDFTR
ncbi:MAG: hypothetical protein M3R50_12770 [Bacteroidota bacterium]|nr:hypothetical protein [Bacteroidota bacterium]